MECQEAAPPTSGSTPESRKKEVCNHMIHLGNFEISRVRLFGILVLIVALMMWLNVSLAGLPLVPLALTLVAVALLW
jgi:hypothetical protein